MSEEQLIKGCLNGERSTQEELYFLYSRKMMGLCMRYVGNRETARDLLQDGFVKVFTSLNLFSGKGSLESWIRKIFQNLIMEHLRKKDFLYDTMDLNSIQSTAEDNSTVSRLSAEMIMEMVRQLPDGFRTVFNLFAIEGYSHKEIGDMLQISEATSRSQYARARLWLQKRMGESGVKN